MGSVPRYEKSRRKDSRVSEHIDTSSFARSPSSIGQDTAMLENWRQSGRSSDLRVISRVLLPKYRGPVNFGEVRGASHSGMFSLPRTERNTRSSRRGKNK